MTKAIDDENRCNFIEDIINGHQARMQTSMALALPSLGFEFCVILEIWPQFTDPQIKKINMKNSKYSKGRKE